MMRKIEVIGPPNAINRKYKKPDNIVIDIINDYCNSSTIHGVSYLGQSNRTIVEKAWWLIMLLFSIAACSVLISRTWVKWKENPVIISFEKEQTPIWSIPFPAVTVCPLNKVAQKEYNYTYFFRQRDNLTNDEFKKFWDISSICRLGQYDEFDVSHYFTDRSAMESIRKVAPSMENIIGKLYWSKRIIAPKEDFFAQQMTEEGLCFTFNTFKQDDIYTRELDQNIQFITGGRNKGSWSLENGNLDSEGIFGPMTAPRDGEDAGLSIHLNSRFDDIDYVCGESISGFKIILHNPVEAPKAAQQYFLLPFNKQISMIVRPELITTSDDLKSLPPSIRKCYFSNERSLRFFTEYTQSNCRRECETNFTLKYCGCVLFYMPRDENTKICGYSRMKCFDEAERLSIKIRINDVTVTKNSSYDEIIKLSYSCNCIQACTGLQYTAETSYTEGHYLKSVLISGVQEKGQNGTNPAIQVQSSGLISKSNVKIFFKDPQFLALSRSELYGQTDFLSNCGGLLGLGMGFSILSLLEIVYFLTLRLWFKYKSRKAVMYLD